MQALDTTRGAPRRSPRPGLRPWNAAAITPRHLLTHSAGLPDSYLAFDEAAMDRQTLELWAYEVLPYTGLNNPPGAFWNYSNPNFSLAGLVVQEQSGQLVVDYTEDAVWEPAGMPLTTFRSEDVVAHGDFAYGHYGSDRLTPDRWSMRALAPAGTAFSTPTELVTWALVLMEDGGGILSPESAAAMQARQISQGYYEGADYGFGVFVTDYLEADDPSRVVTVYDHGSSGSPVFDDDWRVIALHRAGIVDDAGHDDLVHQGPDAVQAGSQMTLFVAGDHTKGHFRAAGRPERRGIFRRNPGADAHGRVEKAVGCAVKGGCAADLPQRLQPLFVFQEQLDMLKMQALVAGIEAAGLLEPA